MNHLKTIALGCLACGFQLSQADFIEADFRTTKGNFTVDLDYVNSPLAVANFVMLAGKPDDVLETLPGVQGLGEPGHQFRDYRPTPDSDVQRLPLRVSLVPATADFRAYFGIYQNTALIGGVETMTSGGFYRDITGQDRIRLQTLSFDPPQYRIILRYPRPWVDLRNAQLKEAPMYRLMQIHRVETGRRFFAGTMTNNRFENPGYHFQDEVTRNPGNTTNPYGTAFDQGGVLAMDNTLRANQNGCGFFITANPEPTLKGRSTAFGRVLNPVNPNVLPTSVQNIIDAPTNIFNEPDNFMLIQDITIRRGGSTAIGFLEGFQNQIVAGPVAPLPFKIERGAQGVSLVSALRPQSLVSTYVSTDLANFSGGFIEGMGPDAVEGIRTNLSFTMSNFPRTFYKGFSVELPDWPSADLDLTNRWLKFTVDPSEGAGLLNLYFNTPVQNEDNEDDGLVRIGGTYGINMQVFQNQPDGSVDVVPSQGTGTFFAIYDATKSPYSGQLTFTNVTGPLNVRAMTLRFESLRSIANRSVASSFRLRRFEAQSSDPQLPPLGYDGVFQVQ